MIKALHGHGYLFIASLASATEEGTTVTEAPPGTAAQVDHQEKLPESGWSLRSTGLAAVAIVVAIALAMELKKEGRALRMNYSLLGPDDNWQKSTIVGDQATELAQGVVQSVYGSILRKSRLGGNSMLVSQDPFNNEAFSRGMGLVLTGRCSEAVQFFKVIIEQEPTLFTPRFEYAACLRILGEWQEAETQRPVADHPGALCSSAWECRRDCCTDGPGQGMGRGALVARK